jgi:hypothetical protein
MKKLGLFFFIGFMHVFLFSGKIYSQYDVEFNEVKGSIDKTDEYKKDLGRYDGYTIPLFDGEAVNFVVYSEKFSPKIFFVNPHGEVLNQNLGTQTNIASIFTTANEDGDWILYVVGDSLTQGDYIFQSAIASKNSLELPANADFCTTFNFVTAHAKAYFLLMSNVAESQNSVVKLKNSIDSYIDNSDGAYTAKMYEGNSIEEAEKIYKEYSEKVGECLGKTWKKKSESWVNIEDYKVKSVLYSEPVKENERIVLVSLQNLTKSKQKFTGNYVVQIMINKKS